MNCAHYRMADTRVFVCKYRQDRIELGLALDHSRAAEYGNDVPNPPYSA